MLLNHSREDISCSVKRSRSLALYCNLQLGENRPDPTLNTRSKYLYLYLRKGAFSHRRVVLTFLYAFRNASLLNRSDLVRPSPGAPSLQPRDPGNQREALEWSSTWVVSDTLYRRHSTIGERGGGKGRCWLIKSLAKSLTRDISLKTITIDTFFLFRGTAK